MYDGMTRRSVLSLAAGLGAGAALAACGEDGGDAGGDLSSDPVTLRFTWWGSDARHKRTQQVIDLFTKANPTITVKGEFKEWNGYWDSLATTVAAGDAPDIIQMDELYLSSYAERGALLDLGGAAKHLSTADFDPNALDTGKVGGKQYAIPTGLAAYSIVVNTDLLAQYKVALPDDTKWTWDDLKRLGAQVSTASGGKVTGVQSFAPPPSVTVERAGGALDQSGTATNTSAFGAWWNTQLTSLAEASGQNLKLLRQPGEAQAPSPGAYYKPSMFWSISARSKHPAEAALFVNFLANTADAGTILLTDRGVPANTKVRAAITPKLTAADKAAADYLGTLKVGPAPRVTPNGASGIEAILKRHTEGVLFERQTPQQAAAAFIKELQAEIDAA
jgi:multiple sugar transport system substrate-binding protein